MDLRDEAKTKSQLIEELRLLRGERMSAADDDSSMLRRRLAIERLRTAALSMTDSRGLLEVVALFLREIRGLGLKTNVASISFLDEQTGRYDLYYAADTPRRRGVTWNSPTIVELQDGTMVAYSELSFSSFPYSVELWRSQTPVYEQRSNEDAAGVQITLSERFGFSESFLELLRAGGGAWIAIYPFKQGIAFIGSTELSEDDGERALALVADLSKGLAFGYVRFLDFLRLEAELQKAHDLQMGLMPKEPPLVQGMEVASRCIPATQVGGDFFQYFHHGEGLSVSTADVTDHGMEAAIPAVVCESGLSDRRSSGVEP